MPHEEEMEDLSSEWKRHTETEALVRQLKNQREGWQRKLYHVASVSEDPEVRRCAAVIETLDIVLREIVLRGVSNNGQK